MLRGVMLVVGLGLVGTAAALGASGAMQPTTVAPAMPVASQALAPDAPRPVASPTVAGAGLLARGITSLANGGAFALLPEAPHLDLLADPGPTPGSIVAVAAAIEAPAEALPPVTETLAAAEPAAEASPGPVRVHAGLPSREGAPGAAVQVNRGLP